MPKKKIENNLLRLQKVIADCGITSRRKAEEMIVQGRVKVNGLLVTELGTKVDVSNDVVEVDGAAIDSTAVQKIYLVMNKPRGYVTTVEDPEGRKTVIDLCREIKMRVFPVGRLDYLSEGLLILTNDGDFANMVMHPRFEVGKTYEVKVFGLISEALLKKMRKGVQDKSDFLKPSFVRIIKHLQNKTWLEFRLNEGKNREIRRICEACGLTVDKLRRVAIEGLSIQGIASGKYEFVTKRQLLENLNLNEDGSKRLKEAVFRSSKKTIRKTRKNAKEQHDKADDPKFKRYRKSDYNETMKRQKEVKRKLAITKKPVKPAKLTKS